MSSTSPREHCVRLWKREARALSCRSEPVRSPLRRRLRPLLREGDRENNSAHSWLVHVFTQPGPGADIRRADQTSTRLQTFGFDGSRHLGLLTIQETPAALRRGIIAYGRGDLRDQIQLRGDWADQVDTLDRMHFSHLFSRARWTKAGGHRDVRVDECLLIGLKRT